MVNAKSPLKKEREYHWIPARRNKITEAIFRPRMVRYHSKNARPPFQTDASTNVFLKKSNMNPLARPKYIHGSKKMHMRINVLPLSCIGSKVFKGTQMSVRLRN